ncbi:response regulator [Pseudomonas luteola]
MMKTTMLLVDDHAIVRQGIRSLLDITGEFDVIGEAGDGQTAIELAQASKPELVLLDLMMPGLSGVETIKRLLEVSPGSQIAVLSSTEEDELAFAAIEAGAQSFLVKTMLGDELIDMIRRIARGEVIIHPFIASKLLKVVRGIREPKVDPFKELTERELDVLRELASGGSNVRIATALNISEKTVKSHISSLLSKLDLVDRTEAVAFAWKQGLMTHHGS